MRFVEKAENQFLAVAAASIIARYQFLLAMDKLNNEVHSPVPLGASAKVEAFARTYAQQHGLKQLAKLVKTNFSTFERIKKSFR